MPESIHWLTRKQPGNALNRVNQAMKRLGHAAVSTLPEVRESDRKKSGGDIFSSGLITITMLLTVAYFMHIITFYFFTILIHEHG